MATLNLGRIKPVFRGAYSGGTAYVVDDIVTSGGSSYICIQAHGAGTQAVTVTAYWSVLASTGTDVGTTITTQGDVLYRDGSGLQRLAKPASNKMLQNTSGGVLSWETPSGGKVLQVVQTNWKTAHSSTSSNGTYADITDATVTITPSATSSKIWVTSMLNMSGSVYGQYIRLQRGGSNITDALGVVSSNRIAATTYAGTPTDNAELSASSCLSYLDSPSSTSALVYKLQGSARSGTTWTCNFPYDDADANTCAHTISTMTAMEIGV